MDGDAFALELADGRILEGWASEAPDVGTAVLFHVGTPSAGLPFEPWVDEATRRGLRFVTYSRPGYAGSTRREGRSVADCAGDVGALARALGLDRLHVAGWSGGGPHALACAALLPGLVVSAATLAGAAPRLANGLDWLDGMAEENLAEFTAAAEGSDALRAFLEDAAVELRDQRGDTIADAFGGLVTDVDHRSLAGPYAEYVASLMRRALASGVWGWHDDDLAFVGEWGFSLGEITVPVTVWQGGQDAMVPFAHGEWLVRHVPRARAMLLEDEGHLSLVLRFGEILDDLLARAQETAQSATTRPVAS